MCVECEDFQIYLLNFKKLSTMYAVSSLPEAPLLKKNEICVCSAQSFQVSTPYFFLTN